MPLVTAIQLRLRRARLMVAAGAVQIDGTLGHFLVHSQTGERQYQVSVHVDPQNGWLMRAHCTCPDWRTMSNALEGWIEATGQSPHPGISHMDYSACCKHTLAALIVMGVIT